MLHGVRILVLEQMSTIAMVVSSSHTFVAMFTLDLVRAFMKLEGFDIALIFDDLLGWVAHQFVLVATF